LLLNHSHQLIILKDSNVNIRKQVTTACKAAFFQLRKIGAIRKYEFSNMRTDDVRHVDLSDSSDTDEDDAEVEPEEEAEEEAEGEARKVEVEAVKKVEVETEKNEESEEEDELEEAGRATQQWWKGEKLPSTSETPK
jgi:hypothetical protein